MIDHYCRVMRLFLKSVETYYSGRLGVAQLISHALDGSLKLLDAVHLAERIRGLQPKNILEVESFLGLSTRWLLEISQAYSSRVVSVDPGLRHRIFDDARDHLKQFCRDYSDRLVTIDA